MKYQAINEAVAQYREASFKKWARISSIATICAGSLILAAHCMQLVRYVLLKREAALLQRTIISLNKAVGDHLQEAKQLKTATHLHAILTANDRIPAMLTTVSKTIPALTILTALRYQPGELTLEGYAPDARELESFSASLRDGGFAHMKLQYSRDEAEGLKFLLSEKPTT